MAKEMKKFNEEIENIYRLKVPYFSVYTSVFLVKLGKGLLLIDCATTDEDVDGIIIPALRELGYELSDVDFLVLTHRHEDHAGGKNRILYHTPNVKVIEKPCEIDCYVSIYEMPGHTKDFIGVYDKRTKTLISGDGLQGAGIKQYRTSLEDKEGYLETIERIRADENIENVLYSHEYEPWYENSALGRERVLACLSDCLDYVK